MVEEISLSIREVSSMEIRQLRYFIAVAENLNFTKAAKQLLIAQPSLSQQINSLEKELGFKLFYRNKHSVELTPAGIVFQEDALNILRKIDEAIGRAFDANIGIIGNLNIGFLNVAIKKFLPQLVRKFKHKYPKIHLNLHHYNTGQIIEKLKSGEIDLAFTVSVGLQNVGEIEMRTIASVTNCIIVHQDHPLACKSSIDIEDLVEEPFVMIEREASPYTYDGWLAECISHGFSPKIASHTKSLESVLTLVDAGIGIAYLPTFMEAYASPTLRFIKIDKKVTKSADLVVVWKKKTLKNPTLPLFLEEINPLEIYSLLK